MNKVMLVGRLSKDPELKQTPSAIPYVQFTLCVNRKYKDKTTGKYPADFINCIAWRQTANLIAQYMHQGTQLGVEGSIQTRNYQNTMGQTVYVTEVLVESVTILESRAATEARMSNQNSFNNQSVGGGYFPQAPVQATVEQHEDPFENINDTYDTSNGDLPF